MAAEEEARPLLAHGTPAADARDHPEVRASLLAKATFSWLGPLLEQGATAPLRLGDLWHVREHDDATHVADKLRAAMRTRVADKLRAAMRTRVAAGDANPFALWRAIHQAFGFNMYLAGLCKLTGDMLGFVGPICINELIKYVEDPSTAWFYPRYYGYIVSATLFLATACQSLCLHQHHHLVIREAIRLRSAMTMVVYGKALALSSQTKSTLGSGHILNLATTDANRLLDLFYMIHYTWAAPLQVAVGMVLLLRFLGYAAFAGVAVMVVLVPTSAFFSSQAAQLSKKLMSCTDKRLKFLNDVLRHIRVIKFYAWENEMLGQVEAIRETELGFLRRMVFWNSFSQVALQAGPILVSLASFTVYSWIQNEPLTADVAFTSLTLFSIFRLPLMALPRIFQLTFQAHVSVERLATYFAVKEHVPRPALAGQDAHADKAAFEIRDAEFGWNEQALSAGLAAATSTTLTLKDVSIRIPTGKLTLVVGPVGSGKSTLLAALLKELQPTAGQVAMPTDRVSYAAQSPYLVNASIEDNIVFGGTRDISRLRKVIASCELQSDLDMLPDGIRTELGENGINLSGGQKQRVSIARAAYPANQQLYIFDDALSALDAKVSTSIFQRSFSESPSALLAGKTRVLATHSLQFAKSAQWIIVMDKMRVVQMGTYEELTKHQPNGALAKMLETFHGAHSTEEHAEETAVALRKKSIELDADAEKREAAQPSRLIGDESRAEGSVSMDVYASYLKSCGVVFCCGALAVLVATQVSQVSTDLWLTRWTSASVTSASQLSFYLSVYAYLSLFTISLGFCGDLTSRLAGLSASRAIHHRLLRHIIKGTMRFFDTTPIGRVLNRFSNDMNTIDQKLNASFISFTTQVLSLLSMLVIQSSSVPFLLVVLLPVFGLYYVVQLFYRKSCRELQRLDSITKSPIFAHFTETLNGLVTIRAFQMVPRTLRDQAFRINENTRAFLSLNLVNRWVGVRLESLGALVILGVACFVAREHAVLSSAMAGLLLSYSQSMSGLLNWIVRSNIDLENAMNSIERTDEYCRVDVEPLVLHEESSPGSTAATSHPSLYLKNRPQWPEQGEIVFKDVQVKYHPDADLVLRGVSFSIKGGEKVGICGRTGAGKSSLLLTLFRLVPTYAGRITIDGVDTTQIDLTKLRSRMAIIPQEPVLFAASVRLNLDPTGVMDDATLWTAIKKSHLHEFVSRLPGQLDAEVLEGGENFSLGERQLICLARAILRDSKILCLDEATASMDHNTDTLIQSSIRREFASATVLTIAHRVQTIIDYDKVMVLKQGRVVEYGSPKKLMAIKGGELASMVAIRTG